MLKKFLSIAATLVTMIAVTGVFSATIAFLFVAAELARPAPATAEMARNIVLALACCLALLPVGPLLGDISEADPA